MQTKDRDYLIDNLKLLLIILVVLGHMISGSFKSNPYCGRLYYIIYSFHMPFFIFVTGYLSKNVEKARNNAFTTILTSFLIFNGLYAVLFEATDYINLFRTHRNFWFLVVIFYYKLLLKDLIKIRFVLPLSFVLSIAIGIFPRPGGYLNISRAVVFLPFFLLGYYCTKEHIQKVREISKWITIPLFITLMAFMGISYSKGIFNKALFLFKNSYEYIGFGDKIGGFYRGTVLVIAVLAGICLINFIPSKQYKFTKWGENTFAIYISHTYVLQLMRNNGFFEASENHIMELLSYVVLSFILVALFGTPQYSQFFNKLKDAMTKIIMKKDKTN